MRDAANWRKSRRKHGPGRTRRRRNRRGKRRNAAAKWPKSRHILEPDPKRLRRRNRRGNNKKRNAGGGKRRNDSVWNVSAGSGKKRNTGGAWRNSRPRNSDGDRKIRPDNNSNSGSSNNINGRRSKPKLHACARRNSYEWNSSDDSKTKLTDSGSSAVLVLSHHHRSHSNRIHRMDTRNSNFIRSNRIFLDNSHTPNIHHHHPVVLPIT